jgi:hypothetical protein
MDGWIAFGNFFATAIHCNTILWWEYKREHYSPYGPCWTEKNAGGAEMALMLFYSATPAF